MYIICLCTNAREHVDAHTMDPIYVMCVCVCLYNTLVGWRTDRPTERKKNALMCACILNNRRAFRARQNNGGKNMPEKAQFNGTDRVNILYT